MTTTLIDLMRGPDGLMSSYLQAAKVAIIIGDTLIVHGAIHTYNMGLVRVRSTRSSYVCYVHHTTHNSYQSPVISQM